MNVYIAEEAGFCFGVKRALKIINQLHEKRYDIQVFGQLIHNRTVLDDLKAKGIECVDFPEQFDPEKKLVIRTHGIPKKLEEKLKIEGYDYADATCPLVKKLHHIIDKLDEEKKSIVIVGDEHHPEIIAAKSYSENARVIGTEEEVEHIPNCDSLSLVAQTTLDTEVYKQIVSLLVDKTGRLEIYNTICGATKTRQKAIRKLAPTVDCVVVIGGKNSSNTTKLFKIASKKNKNSFHIEKSSDLNTPELLEKISGFRSAGITAGASTPPEEIENVKNILLNII